MVLSVTPTLFTSSQIGFAYVRRRLYAVSVFGKSYEGEMPYCSALGCKTKEADRKAVPPLTFHRFPTDVDGNFKWIQAVKRPNWKPAKTSRLCSKHFKEDDFDRSSPFCIKLKKTAVPSIFHEFPNQLQKTGAQMVRKRVRKSNRDKCTAEDLKKSKQAIAQGLSVREASEKYKIPFSILCNELKKGTDCKPILGRKSDFPRAFEKALAKHVKTLSKICFGITATKLRKLAFEYAEDNNLKHRFNKETKMADLDWMYGFIARHRIRLQKPYPEGTVELQDDMDVDNTNCSDEKKEINETSKDADIVIKIEPDQSYMDEACLSSDDTKDNIGGFKRLDESVPSLQASMLDIDNSAFCKQEDEDHINSKNTSIEIKREADITSYIPQGVISQDNDNIEDSIPGCSQLKEESSRPTNSQSSLQRLPDTKKTSKGDAEMQGNRQPKMRDQQQQTNEMPIAERWMIKWYADQPIAEPVLDEVLSKKPLTSAERKRKSWGKRTTPKFSHHEQESCFCGSNLKTRDQLRMEVDALTHRKTLLLTQIAWLQAQARQVNHTDNDSEDDSSNVSTNDTIVECSRFREVSWDANPKLKKTMSVDKDHEISYASILKTFVGLNGLLDDFHIFGEFVATELRNLKSDVNRRRLKRMIQKFIIEVSESEEG